MALYYGAAPRTTTIVEDRTTDPFGAAAALVATPDGWWAKVLM